MAEAQPKLTAVDPLWNRITEEAQQAVRVDPSWAA